MEKSIEPGEAGERKVHLQGMRFEGFHQGKFGRNWIGNGKGVGEAVEIFQIGRVDFDDSGGKTFSQ
jgi:hypothetical protein